MLRHIRSLFSDRTENLLGAEDPFTLKQQWRPKILPDSGDGSAEHTRDIKCSGLDTHRKCIAENSVVHYLESAFAGR